MDCVTFNSLWKHYSKKNDGLFDFINQATKKPEHEPFFPGWTYEDTISKCRNYTDSDGEILGENIPLTAPYIKDNGETINSILRV